ncbi:MAG: hypothetical protein WC114_07915 [Smithellaceae bacterium]|jgi:hypothetical protein
MYPTISDNPAVQQDYERMRERGQSHNIAEMLALKRTPTLRTDATLLAAVNGAKEDFSFEQDNLHSKAVVKTAKRLGVHPKQYQPTLADYAGDPKAFIPNDNARGHLKRVAQHHKDRCARAVDTELKNG